MLKLVCTEFVGQKKKEQYIQDVGSNPTKLPRKARSSMVRTLDYCDGETSLHLIILLLRYFLSTMKVSFLSFEKFFIVGPTTRNIQIEHFFRRVWVGTLA